MSVVDRLSRRASGDFEVDEWGLDPDLIGHLSPLLGLRWSLDVSGGSNVPESGPALLVFNRRFGSSEPFVVARGVRTVTRRHVRIAGAPDLPVAGSLLRKMGGVLDRRDEIASVMRAGHLAGVGLDRSLVWGPSAGAARVDAIAEARTQGVPVIPVALIGREMRRGWRVEIGRPVPDRRPLGPLGDVEIAEAVRDEIASMLATRVST